MDLELRTCQACTTKFKTLKSSPQNGCCQEHDSRGQMYRSQRTLRRLHDIEVTKIYAKKGIRKKRLFKT